jgi:pimeloyl-ACP methyl ester carboxylesterase
MDGVSGGIRWSAQGTLRDGEASLLFIHGAGANRAVWWQQFAAFTPSHHVIAYDLPGFGESNAADPERLVEQSLEAAVAVLAAAGAARAKVVCQSLGGWTQVRLALARPDLVERLVLACTLAGIAHPPRPPVLCRSAGADGPARPGSAGAEGGFRRRRAADGIALPPLRCL